MFPHELLEDVSAVGMLLFEYRPLSYFSPGAEL